MTASKAQPREMTRRRSVAGLVTSGSLPGVAVVIPCHNYGSYLRECLESVLSQTMRPAEVVVVDDGSDDDTSSVARQFAERGVALLRVEHRNVYLARRAGLLATTSPLIVFLDADDQLEPSYIEACHRRLMGNGQVGIVTTDLQAFGTENRVIAHTECNLESQNWIHAGSMVRRCALIGSGAYDFDRFDLHCHDDWFVWREVVRCGWLVERISSPLYLYRKHPLSMMHTLRATRQPYYQLASLATEPITLVLPLSGREHYWPRLSAWCEQEHRITDVLVLDSSSTESFRSDVVSWMNRLPVRSVKRILLPSSHGLADADRRNQSAAYFGVQRAMPAIYRHLRQSLVTEFAMVVEDDVLPPSGTVERLLSGVGHDVAAVSGVVPSRWNPERAIAWQRGFAPILMRDLGSNRIDVEGTGFGCLLLRRSAMLDAAPFHNGGTTGNFDQEFATEVRASGWRWRMDCSVVCAHGEIVPERAG